MPLTRADFRSSSAAPRTREVDLGTVKVTVRALVAIESDAIEQAFPRPGVPLIPHPKQPPERADMIMNPGDPAYIAANDRWLSRTQYAQFAAATGYAVADGSTFDSVRREKPGDLSGWMVIVESELGEMITWKQVTKVLKAVDELSVVGDPKGVQEAAKNS